MPETIDAVRKLISERLSELETETARLELALKSIGGRDGSRPTAPKSKSKKVAAKSRRRRAQAPRGQRREQLLEAIKAKPGIRPSELAAVIGISPGQVSGLLSKVRAQKLIVKKGAGYALKE